VFARRLFYLYLVTNAALLLAGAFQPVRAHETQTDWLTRGRSVRVWRCIQCEGVRELRPGDCSQCGLRLYVRRERFVGVAALMLGVPSWLFYSTAISLIFLSFILFAFWGRRKNHERAAPARSKFLRIPGVERLTRRPLFQTGVRIAIFLLFITVIVGALRSSPEPERDIVPALTWALWSVWLALVATRPLRTDSDEPQQVRTDEAFLALTMLTMSSFHGLTMTTRWGALVRWIESALGLDNSISLALGMVAMLLLPLVVYYGICMLMKWLASDRTHSTQALFVNFAFSLLPIALFYHVAHHAKFLMYGGMQVGRLVLERLGLDWELFGPHSMPVADTIPIVAIWGVQVTLIIIGHIYAIVVAHRTSVALYQRHRQAVFSQIPMLVAMLLFSFQSLWLIAQPMRTMI
jgi:hypothetical protein